MQNKKAEAQSKSQQRFMGMVYAYKDGTLDTSKFPSELLHKIKKASSGMTKKEVDEFASTSHKGLPEKKATMNKHIQKGFTAEILKEALNKKDKVIFESYKDLHTKGIRRDMFPKLIASQTGDSPSRIKKLVKDKGFYDRITKSKVQRAGKYMKSVARVTRIAAKRNPGTTVAISYLAGRSATKKKK